MPTFFFPVFFPMLVVLGTIPEKPNFQDDILPILDQSCNSCHNPEKTKGSLVMTSLTELMNGGSSGNIVVPRNSNSSALYLLAAHEKEPHMPPRGQAIEEEQLKLIKIWIDQGLRPTASGEPIKEKIHVALELKTKDFGKPKGPPPMPKNLNLEPFLITERGFTPSAMETSPWSPLIAIACPKQILIYHTETLELQAILPYPEGFAESLAFSKNGSLLLASGGKGGKSGKVVAWDIQSGQRMITLGQEKDSILTTDINPDQSLIAIGGTSKIVKVFDLGSGEVLYDIKKHSEWVTQVAISPDGILMATGDRNGGLHIWEVETGNPFYTLSGHQAEITDLSWRSDGNILLSSSEDGTLHMWEMISGKKVRDWEAHPQGVLSAHFDKKANIISSGRDRKVICWNNNGNEIRTISGFKDIVTESRFSQDGQRLIAADWIGNITVWDPLDGKQYGSLQSNPPSIKKRIRAYELKLSQVQQQVVEERDKARPLLNTARQIESQVKQNKQKKKDLALQISLLEKSNHTLKIDIQTQAKKLTQITSLINSTISQINKKESEIKQVSAKIGKEKRLLKELELSKKERASTIAALQKSSLQILPKNADKNKSSSQIRITDQINKRRNEINGINLTLADKINFLREITEKEKQLLLQKHDLSNSLSQMKWEKKSVQNLHGTISKNIQAKGKEIDQLQVLSRSTMAQLKILEKKSVSNKQNTKEALALIKKAERETQSLHYNIKKWKAEKINTQRHKVLATVHEIKARIELQNRRLTDVENTHNLALQELERKAEELLNLPNNITKAREEITAKQELFEESITIGNDLEKKQASTIELIKQTEGFKKKETHEDETISLSNLRRKLSQITSDIKSQKEETTLASTDKKHAKKVLHGLMSQLGNLPAIIKDKKVDYQSALTSLNQIHKEISTLQKMEQEKHKQAQALLEDYQQALPKG